MSVAEEAAKALDHFGVTSAGTLVSYSPIDGAEIGRAVGRRASRVARDMVSNPWSDAGAAAGSWSESFTAGRLTGVSSVC